MINKVTTWVAVIGVGILFGLAVVPFAGSPAYAAACTGTDCVGTGINAVGNTGGGTDLNAVFKRIVNVLLFIIGAVSVIMIVIAGIKYTTSNGDTSAITSAKNTILYAVIGLIVAALAYAIINFVITQFVS